MSHFGKFMLAVATACIFFLVSTSIAQDNSNLPYMNPKLSPEERATDLVHRMTLAEKASEMQNNSAAVPRLEVPAYQAAFAKKVHLLWVGVGTKEPERMRAGLFRLHSSLQEANIQHVFYESPGTDHEWQTWRRDLKDFPGSFKRKRQSLKRR